MIGWYLHHHGQGHLQRLRTLAPRLREPVVVFSSLPQPLAPEAPELAGVTWVRLPNDWEPSHAIAPIDADPSAGGSLHWAPLHHAGFQTRMMNIAAWAGRLSCLVVDVSAEVVMLGRLLGVPTIAVTQPGDRGDRAHQTALGMATAVIAPFIRPLPGEGSDPLLQIGERVTFTGGLSVLEAADARDDSTGAGSSDDAGSRPAVPRRSHRAGARTLPARVLLVGSRGGFGVSAEDARAAAAATRPLGANWRMLGIDGAPWSHDVAQELRECDVAVIGAGLGSVADAAALQVPAIVMPQERPFGEQHATAAMLRRIGVTVVDTWPNAQAWPQLLTRAAANGGAPWRAWCTDGAAARATAVIHGVLDRWPNRTAPDNALSASA